MSKLSFICIVQLLVFLYVHAFHNSLRPIKGHHSSSSQLLATKIDEKLEIRFAENADIPRVAEFLANAMYEQNIPFGQKRKLVELEKLDLQKTYGETMGKRKFPAALILAEIEEEFIGTVGLDCQILNVKANKFRRIPKGWEYTDLKSTEKLGLVMANLSTRIDKRKRGYAKMLIKEAEALAKELMFEELYLLVDSENTPAQKLYEKNGFVLEFKDEDATCVASTPLSLKTQECVNFGYRKSIVAAKVTVPGGNAISSFFGGLFGK